MLGAIAGDIIGSVFEAFNVKTTDFPLFSPDSKYTDDTVLTVAIAHSILNDVDYAVSLKDFGRRYWYAGFGPRFFAWLRSEDYSPYNSWGNGSAMRVSPVGFAFNTRDEVLEQARKSAEATHNHPEAVKGAQATALAIYLARTGYGKEEIKKEITECFGYSLDRTLDEIQPTYTFDASCQGTVPESLIAFLESEGYEDAVRKSISIGGDSDTIACITGGIAQAFYGEVPGEIVFEVRERLPDLLLEITEDFCDRFGE